MSFFRQEIPSNKAELDLLHQQYPWIPGSTNIRPLPDQIMMKKEDLQEIEKNWNSMNDYLFFKVFGYDFTINEAGRFICNIPSTVSVTSLKKLVRNQYPYNNLHCYHYIMWYGCQTKPSSSEQITRDIEKSIEGIIHPKDRVNFQFVWYENPKMTIPQLYHVHVFWIPHLP